MQIKNQLLTFSSTSPTMLSSEVLHLDQEMNKCKTEKENVEKKTESVIFEPEEIKSTYALQPYFDEIENKTKHKVRALSSFKMTNNGFYGYKTGIYHKVIQIDNHSLQPTMFKVLGMLDDVHLNLYNQKKQIEKDPKYKSHSRKVERRANIKLKLNKYCATSCGQDTDEHKEQSDFNRKRGMYSGANLVFDEMNFWGLNTIVNVVNDGFVSDVSAMSDEEINKKFDEFKKRYQQLIPYLTFSFHIYKHAIIKNAQQYVLINNLDDYKCINWHFDKGMQYSKLTHGRNLKEDQQSKELSKNENLQKQLKKAQELEMNEINYLYHYLQNKNTMIDNFFKEETKQKHMEQLMVDSGIDLNDLKVANKKHYYLISLKEDDNQTEHESINKYFRILLQDSVWITDQEIAGEHVNLFNQVFTITEIDSLAEINNESDGNIHVYQFYPFFIDSKQKSQNIYSWIKYVATSIKKSDHDHEFQTMIMSNMAATYAKLNNDNPNHVVHFINKMNRNNSIKYLTLADKVRNDPNVMVVDQKIYVKDPTDQVYKGNDGVVDALIQNYMNTRSTISYTSAIKDVKAQMTNSNNNVDHFDNGFKTPSYTILFKKDKNNQHMIDVRNRFYGNVRLKTYFDPDMTIFSYEDLQNSEEGKALWALLDNVSGGKPELLAQALGTIFAQDLIPSLRVFFNLWGVPGSGKSLLAKLMSNLFNGIHEDEHEEYVDHIISPSSDLNNMLSPRSVDRLSIRNGQVALWFDDFQKNQKQLTIEGKVSANINKITNNAPLQADNKFEAKVDVKLPSTLIVASNDPLVANSQLGTSDRMFVFHSPNPLNKNPKFKVKNIDKWKNSPKTMGLFFRILLLGASQLYYYADNHSDLEMKNYFKPQDNAVKKSAMLGDRLSTFFERKGINSPYNLIGIQNIKLFNEFQAETLSDNKKVSRTFFNKQLELLGLHLEDHKIGGKTYRKIIMSNNSDLNKEKMKLMQNKNITPADLNVTHDYGKTIVGSFEDWNTGYDDLKKKYSELTVIFEEF